MQKSILPPTYFFVLLGLSVVTIFLIPVFRVDYFPGNLFGILLIISGLTINIWADHLFKIRQTTVLPHEKPTRLTVDGPFKISRHPMYLGMAALLLGIAILSQALIAFLFPVLFIIIIERKFIPIEETNLRQVFGAEYAQYRAQVRRWL
jgi:protein-S-isoprenylcysteine O-methyltransferase Ste14